MYRDPIGYRIKTLNNLIRRYIDHSHDQRPSKATMMHSWIIGYIQDREDCGLETFQKDIEKEFSINRSTTSEMMKLMVKKGMIERVPVDYDARLKKIVLTNQSREFNNRIGEFLKDLHTKLIDGLTEEEINSFIEVTDKLINNMMKHSKKD